MMTAPGSIDSMQADPEAAIATVLGAEREANTGISRCREDAQAIVAEAGSRALAIAARADRRVSRLRERLRTRLAQTLVALEADIEDEPRQDPRELDRLERAGGQLALELTTGHE